MRVGERFGKTVRVSAFVNVPVEIVAARHSIAKNQVLTADDLETRTMDATRIRGAVIRSLDDAVGLVARRAVSAGEPLKKSDLAAAPVVRKGDIVTLVVQSPGLSLTAYGVVQESAAAGDVAKIQNLDSGVELRARITDAHTAHVEL
ncbi:MAG: flagellar basal body P-ring formation chaperone FlgA [Deltaproteobacteria bacterium]|nr:flagellar basal body P-ring formation chaperone FlgA [Deltaproteobacteria bacterium]